MTPSTPSSARCRRTESEPAHPDQVRHRSRGPCPRSPGPRRRRHPGPGGEATSFSSGTATSAPAPPRGRHTSVARATSAAPFRQVFPYLITHLLAVRDPLRAPRRRHRATRTGAARAGRQRVGQVNRRRAVRAAGWRVLGDDLVGGAPRPRRGSEVIGIAKPLAAPAEVVEASGLPGRPLADDPRCRWQLLDDEKATPRWCPIQTTLVSATERTWRRGCTPTPEPAARRVAAVLVPVREATPPAERVPARRSRGDVPGWMGATSQRRPVGACRSGRSSAWPPERLLVTQVATGWSG